MTPAAQPSEGTPVRRGRGRPRKPETDQRIIKAAGELLVERGFERMTVDEVAGRAGVGKATVYRRWDTKEDLAVAAMERLYAAEFPEPDTGSVEGDLRRMFTDLLAFANSPEGTAYFRTSMSEAIRDERIADLYRSATMSREEQARNTLRRAVERGEVRADVDLDPVVQWLSGIIAVRVITNRPPPRPEEVDGLVDLVLRGIRA